jgi:hypothetical protein
VVGKSCGVTAHIAAGVRRVDQHRVDDQRLGGIVRGDPKADPIVAVENILAGDRPPAAGDLLVDDRLSLPNDTASRAQFQIPLRVQADGLRACEAQHHPLGDAAGPHDQVVLELPLVAVVDEVDARVDVFVLHSGIRRHIGPPLRGIVADEVVGLAGQGVLARDARIAIGADERHAKRGLRRGVALRPAAARSEPCVARRFRCGHEEHRLGGREKQRVTARVRQELHGAMRLTAIGLEGEGKLAVRLPCPELSGRFGPAARRRRKRGVLAERHFRRLAGCRNNEQRAADDCGAGEREGTRIDNVAHLFLL